MQLRIFYLHVRLAIFSGSEDIREFVIFWKKNGFLNNFFEVESALVILFLNIAQQKVLESSFIKKVFLFWCLFQDLLNNSFKLLHDTKYLLLCYIEIKITSADSTVGLFLQIFFKNTIFTIVVYLLRLVLY